MVSTDLLTESVISSLKKMSKVTEKRTFKIPPCKIDKRLVKEIGQILEEESPRLYNELVEIDTKAKSETDYYKKYPETLREDVESSIFSWQYKPNYALIANSKNVTSTKIASFINTEWPSDIGEITLSMGYSESPKRIKIAVYLEKWRMEYSEVSVSAEDSTWVNGIADRLETIFQKRKLGHHFIVTQTLSRVALSILAWISIAFAITHVLWPLVRPFLKEGISWIMIFAIVSVLGGMAALWPLEAFLSWLFPRFEFGETSLPRRVRKIIWALLIGSGIIAEIIFRLIGL